MRLPVGSERGKKSTRGGHTALEDVLQSRVLVGSRKKVGAVCGWAGG